MKSTAIALNAIRNLRNEQTKKGIQWVATVLAQLANGRKKISDHMIDDVSKERWSNSSSKASVFVRGSPEIAMISHKSEREGKQWAREVVTAETRNSTRICKLSLVRLASHMIWFPSKIAVQLIFVFKYGVPHLHTGVHIV